MWANYIPNDNILNRKGIKVIKCPTVPIFTESDTYDLMGERQ